MHRIGVAAVSMTAVAALAGCSTREVSKVELRQWKQETKDIPVAQRDVDILFLIDDSNSMGEEQETLRENFPRFIQILQDIEGGLPDVHIGIISSNVGAHPEIEGCRPEDSDAGRLQHELVGDEPACHDGSLSLDGAFISDVLVDKETGERERNYTGDLSAVFSCMAKLGVGGCGFEGQLESIRLALSSPENAGFLRENAWLAIIIVTDEDDCSARGPEMFDPTITALNSTLGPLDSFRCFEFGVQCQPDTPRVPGDKVDCHPRKDSPYMPDVDEYVRFVKGLKANDDKIIVSGIIGYDPEHPDEPLTVEEIDRGNGELLSLVPACEVHALDEQGHETDEIESRATTGVRLRYFLEQFPNNHTIETICQHDLGGALTLIAKNLAGRLKNPFCLTTDVDVREATADVHPYDCQVSDIDGTTGEETPLPHCDRTDGDPSIVPCWYIRQNEAECAWAGAPFQELVVARTGATPASDVIIRCAVH